MATSGSRIGHSLPDKGSAGSLSLSLLDFDVHYMRLVRDFDRLSTVHLAVSHHLQPPLPSEFRICVPCLKLKWMLHLPWVRQRVLAQVEVIQQC